MKRNHGRFVSSLLSSTGSLGSLDPAASVLHPSGQGQGHVELPKTAKLFLQLATEPISLRPKERERAMGLCPPKRLVEVGCFPV